MYLSISPVFPAESGPGDEISKQLAVLSAALELTQQQADEVKEILVMVRSQAIRWEAVDRAVWGECPAGEAAVKRWRRCSKKGRKKAKEIKKILTEEQKVIWKPLVDFHLSQVEQRVKERVKK